MKKLKESVFAVLPITAIILILNFSTKPMHDYNLLSFVIGAILLTIGMSIYSLGVDIAIEPIGHHISSTISHSKKLWFILLCVFIIGIIVTIAEPDLTVLASQVSINNWTLILTVSAGVGLFMLFAVLRIVLKINLNVILIVLYSIVFILIIFVDENLIPLAFDAGGVTTGPITVPFIMAIGIGISSVLCGSKSQENSFGMVGICSIGPIMAVLILSLINDTESSASIITLSEFKSLESVFLSYFKCFPIYLKEVGIALAPITGFFLLMQIFIIKLPKKQLLKLIIGIIYTYLGLSIFLLGVNVGFMPTGTYIGAELAKINPYLIIPIGIIVGASIVLAEPAIHVLTHQVETVTSGTITRNTMFITLIISTSISVGLSMLRVATGISLLYILLPGYLLALILTFFVPKIFTGIAFDSGGVASGPMTATFLLPFAMGACSSLGGNIMSDAFGTVALVALTPLFTIQILGLIYKIKITKRQQIVRNQYIEMLSHEGEIIEFEI